MSKRKVIQIALGNSLDPSRNMLYALTDDGNIYLATVRPAQGVSDWVLIPTEDLEGEAQEDVEEQD